MEVADTYLTGPSSFLATPSSSRILVVLNS